MEIIDQTKQVLLKDKPFMTLTEAARYTGVGQHKLSELSDDPECEFVFWVGKKRMFKREKLVDYLSKAYSICAKVKCAKRRFCPSLHIWNSDQKSVSFYHL